MQIHLSYSFDFWIFVPGALSLTLHYLSTLLVAVLSPSFLQIYGIKTGLMISDVSALIYCLSNSYPGNAVKFTVVFNYGPLSYSLDLLDLNPLWMIRNNFFAFQENSSYYNIKYSSSIPRFSYPTKIFMFLLITGLTIIKNTCWDCQTIENDIKCLF